MFQPAAIGRLASSLVTKDQPIYVQYYVTARCNLACEQCNIIYANADAREATTDQARAVAENLAKIGVSVVLLTGGEPFVRRDLPQIVRAMTANGIHVRIQTNGLARREDLEACVQAGAKDISISLDSIHPSTQDVINGGFQSSWERAIRTIAWVNEIFPQDSFAALGCVLAPKNFAHVPDLIRFATEIGWWVSLVPAHTSPPDAPMGFRTFDQTLNFPPEILPQVDEVLDEIDGMRRQGYNLYDSKPYFEDLRRFVHRQPMRWRDRNGGVCDSPNLYFAIRPDATMAVCCDWRMNTPVSVAAADFAERYDDPAIRAEIHGIASACGGCLFGSFPEITISARYVATMIRRSLLFGGVTRRASLRRLSADEMMAIAETIRSRSAALYATPVVPVGELQPVSLRAE